MPKVKTSRAAAKRFKKNQVTGQLKRMKAYKEPHLNKEICKEKREISDMQL